MKYFKPINIFYELAVLIFIFFMSRAIANFLIPSELLYEYPELSPWLGVIWYGDIILCLILIASITIRGMRKYPERIIISNFLFGLIVGITFAELMSEALSGKFIEITTIEILSVFKLGIIIGFVAVLLGWVIQIVIKFLKKIRNMGF